MNKQNIDNITIADIDHRDAPDYVDAFIESADYNGIPMTEAQLDEINEDSEFVYECVLEFLY